MRIANNSARLALLGAVAAFAACGEDSVIDEIVVRIEVAPELDSVAVGEISSRISATAFNVRDKQIADPLLTWRSDQPFIASVDSLTGAVTGVALGVAAITAAAGAISDTAEVIVVPNLTLTLLLDTILLAAGDTFTIPVDLVARGQMAPPPIAFSGGAGAIATIDAATGLVTAVGTGTVGFTVTADTLMAIGAVEVREIPDTTFGLAYVRVSGGGINLRGRLASRAFNHPTDDGRSIFQIPMNASLSQQVAIVLIDSLSGPSTRSITQLPPTARQPSADAVCFPVESFAFYRDVSGAVEVSAFSQPAGGAITVTSVRATLGGRAISGRFDIRLQRDGVAGSAGAVTAVGTFVVPLLDLSGCPK